MKFLEAGANHITGTQVEDGKLHIKTTFYDDASLARNERIRSSKILEKAKLSLHHNEDIRAVISVPSVAQWNLFNKEHPELSGLLNSKQEYERLKAVDIISLAHPDWILMTRM